MSDHYQMRLSALEDFIPDQMKEQLVINAISLLIALGALAAAVWTLFTGKIGREGIDGLFLVLVCLFLAATFALLPVQALRKGLWKEFRKARKEGSE